MRLTHVAMLADIMQTNAQHGTRARLLAGMRLVRTATASLLLFALSSCFTMALWGFEPDDEHDPVTGNGQTMFKYDTDTEWSWPLFFGRVLATPVTVCLDLLTAPAQDWWFDDADDKRPRRSP